MLSLERSVKDVNDLKLERYLYHRGWRLSEPKATVKKYSLMYNGRIVNMVVPQNMTTGEFLDAVSALSAIEERPENSIIKSINECPELQDYSNVDDIEAYGENVPFKDLFVPDVEMVSDA